MNETFDELKTVAILALHTQVLPGSEEQWQRFAERFSTRLLHPVCVVQWANDERSFNAFQSTIERYSDQGFQRFVVMPIGLEPFDFQALSPVFIWIRSEREGESFTSRLKTKSLQPIYLSSYVS